jgi:alpha-L-rhamnosidase
VGYHELWINGRKVGDDVLQPSVTDHTKRARYQLYEVADYLRPGTNTLGLWLGTAWSVFPKFETPDKPRAPIVLGQFDFNFPDDPALRIGTDASWRTRPSPNRLLGVWDFMRFGGEEYDATTEPPGGSIPWSDPRIDETGWKPVQMLAPKLILSADPVEPNRRVLPLQAVALSEPQPGVYRFDLGRHFVGMIEFDVRDCLPGDRVELQWSEQDQRPMTHQLRQVYVVGPSGHGTFRNRFNYGAGRWLTVTGLRSPPALADVRAWMVRSDYASAAQFECSNPLFNHILHVTRWTFENLSLGGYLVDCPHRERMGYGGDAHASTTTGLRNYQLGALYTKWAEDWRDSQGSSSAWGVGANAAQSALEPGNLPYTAPTYWGGGGPAWGGFVVHLPSEMWTAYADQRLVESMLPTIERWLAFLETKQHDNLLRRWGGEWDFLGDWLWPGAQGVNGDTRETLFFNNGYWIYNLQTAARLASILGRDAQAAAWNQRADEIRRAVHAAFFDPAEPGYVDHSQACLAMALVAHIPPPELREAIEKRLEKEILVHRQGHIHAGITGGAFLFRALRELNRDDLIHAMVAQDTYPSWGDMLNQGATTFWESWENNPALSYIHSSYLYVGAWFIEGVLGIQPLPNHPGFSRFALRPAPLDRPDLTWARGHYDSIRGRITTAWRRSPRGFDLDVTLPPGTRAVIHLPATHASQITENGLPLDRLPGSRVVGADGGRVLVEVGSGHYQFLCKP